MVVRLLKIRLSEQRWQKTHAVQIRWCHDSGKFGGGADEISKIRDVV